MLTLEALLSLVVSTIVSLLLTQLVKRRSWDNNAIRALSGAIGGCTGLLAWLVALVQWFVSHQPVPPEQWPPAPEALAMIGAGLLAGGGATAAVAATKAARKPAKRRGL